MSMMKLLKPLAGQWSRGLHTSKSLCEATIIDGKAIANQLLEEIKLEVDAWVGAGERQPKLVAVLVGENRASQSYVGRKMRAAKSVGILNQTTRLNANISQEDLLKRIHELNKDPRVDGLLVQLPLPDHISEREVCQAVAPSKDVDGFNMENIGRLALNDRGIIPATALGVKELIIRAKIPTFGKNAVVIGRSKHVGFPIALLLHSDGKGESPGLDMTTTICHRFTPRDELQRYTKQADVVVVSAGVPGLVTKEMIKPGACVIDVGISKVARGDGTYKMVGDVDFESVKEVAGHITPVPGGVGPMTVAMLMRNTLDAAKSRKKSQQ